MSTKLHLKPDSWWIDERGSLRGPIEELEGFDMDRADTIAHFVDSRYADLIKLLPDLLAAVKLTGEYSQLRKDESPAWSVLNQLCQPLLKKVEAATRPVSPKR